jgi:acyl carrier protein
MATVFERVQRVVAETYGVERECVTLKTHILHELSGDSLAQVECVMALEEEFSLLFGEDATEYATVEQVVRYISRQLGIPEEPIVMM